MTVSDRILALAHTNPHLQLTAGFVAAQLGIGTWAAHKTLQRMKARGLLYRPYYGVYQLAGRKPLPRPASEVA